MKRFGKDLLGLVACLLATGAALPTRVEATGSQNVLWSTDWSADGKSFAVGGAWLGVFNATALERVPTPALDSIKAVAKVSWHPTQNLLAFSGGGDGGSTGIYDPATDRKTTLTSPDGTRGISWNWNGELLAGAGNRGELLIWNAKGELQHSVRPEKSKSLTGVAWHPRENKLISIGEFIRLHDANGTITKQITHRPAAKGLVLLLSVEWHPSGEFFVVGDYGNKQSGDEPELEFWSADGRLLKTVKIEEGAAVRSLSWNHDGSLLASASDALRIWSKDGELKRVGKSPDLLWGAKWNRSGDRLLTSSHEGRVTLWSANANVVKEVVKAPTAALCVNSPKP